MLRVAIAALVAASIAFAVSISRGDDESSSTSTPTSPTRPRPSSDPFKPFDTGPVEGHWRYEDLNTDEKAVVDRNRDRAEAAAVHAAYGSAVREHAARARSEAAAYELQAQDSSSIGVVP